MATAGNGSRLKQTASALPWLSPALALIVAIVLFPAGVMVYTSTRDLSLSGVDRGGVGLDNYRQVFENDGVPRVLLNTAIWVSGVVLVTVLISLALAQFLNKEFPGRRTIRLAILIPWAASVVMTTTVFYYMLEPNVGILNKFLVQIHVLDETFGFTKQPTSALAVAMVVGVFVSVPFTTYTILAGLQTIPTEILEAADVDGVSPWQRYTRIVLPQLRGALAVAVIINIINVFNSLPILRVITGDLPGIEADTTTSLTFKLLTLYREPALAQALSVFNFGLVLVIIVVYMAVTRPLRED
ncbi:MAG: sugar ABC transporter permease [Nocardioidaceae bacterium]|nr:sugar ABC transporter permease [Nocardioidaceae bacterium]